MCSSANHKMSVKNRYYYDRSRYQLILIKRSRVKVSKSKRRSKPTTNTKRLERSARGLGLEEAVIIYHLAFSFQHNTDHSILIIFCNCG